MDKIDTENKQLNIEIMAERQNLKVENTTTTITSLEEMQSQLRIKEADATYKRIRDLILLLFGLLMIVSVFSLCIWILLKENIPSEYKTFAFATIGAIVAGFIGYFTGRASKEKD